MKTWMWAVVGVGAYSLYQKNKTGQWPWESLALAGGGTGGQWTVSLYDASREMSSTSQWGSEVDARGKASAQLAACPSCKITITNPAGNVVYQVNG